MTDFDPQAWLELGRANRDKLPDGVVLPEPEIDYERYRAVLQKFYETFKVAVNVQKPMDPYDLSTIDGLLAVADEVIALRDAPKGDGWIDWHGGECPVPPSTEVQYKMRGTPDTVYPAAYAGSLRWRYGTGYADLDIVAYRIVQED